MTDFTIPRIATPYGDLSGPELKQQRDTALLFLTDPNCLDITKTTYETILRWVETEIAERFSSVIDADADGFVSDADLRLLVRGAGLLSPVTAKTEEKEAHRQVIEAKRTAKNLEDTVQVLQKRVEINDQKLKILNNRGLGSAAPVAAALVPILISERPSRPGNDAGYRVPLAKLADATGLSEDACSRQLKKLSEYTLDDGTPVLHREVVNVPGGVDSKTGETGIPGLMPHKELFVGPGVTVENFAEVLATLQPAQKPTWGGKRDVVCPEHPGAGVIKRTKTTITTSFECAECHAELQKTNTIIGQPTAEQMPEIPPHEVTGWLDDTDEAPAPMPQDAASITVNSKQEIESKSSGKMRHSEIAQPLFAPSAATAEQWAEGLALLSRPATPIDIESLTDTSIGARNRARSGAPAQEGDSFATSRLAQSLRDRRQLPPVPPIPRQMTSRGPDDLRK